MSRPDNLRPAEAHRYPKIVRFVRETPWAILPDKLLEIQQMVAMHAAGHRFTLEELEERIGSGPARRDSVTAGSVAVVPVYGVITPRADILSETSGGTSIDRLQQTLRQAVRDDKVKAILLDVNSPGGSVSMLNEMASEIRAARRTKPVVAVANTMAASAAYHLASQASQLYVTPSGSVGAIGTIATHDDVSAMLEQQGVKTTVVTSSKYKGELTPFAPLSDEARAHLQSVVDKHGGQFERDVARGRNTTVDVVRSDFGQGRMLLASDALQAGMVDGVASFDQVLQNLNQQHSPATIRAVRADMQRALAAVRADVQPQPFLALGDADDSVFYEGPIAPKSTSTSDSPWDGPANKARLRNDGDEAYYRKAFAWQDDTGDPSTKAAYKFIHHEVNGNGDVGAASVKGCIAGIAVLNGGRGGTTIPDSDRQGVWNHLARHIRDAGSDPPPLKSLQDEPLTAAHSGLSFADAASTAPDALEDFVASLDALADVRDRGRLTAAKRQQVAACRDRASAAADHLTRVLAATDPDKQRNHEAGVIAEFLARRTREATT